MLGQVSQGRGPPYIADELSPQTQALQSKLESEGASLWTATPAWPTSSLELEDGKNSLSIHLRLSLFLQQTEKGEHKCNKVQHT
jgi:hypothetical protein